MRRYLESSLDVKLAELLPIIQERIMHHTSYFGVRALKNPLDFWVYQEILHGSRPDVVVEIGNNWGGSTLALAHTLDLLGHGRVIGIDVSHEKIAPEVRAHPRITLVEGDAPRSFDRVASLIEPDERTVVIEDSAHTYDNTLAVLERYSALVKIGDYFIVEDTICHHGLDVGPDPGPFEAVDTFLSRHPEFVVDRERESFLVTWNPRGFLRRAF